MRNDVKPALTKEQWNGGVPVNVDMVDLAVWLPEDGAVHIQDYIETYVLRFSPDERHALAALALHRQGYGFSWEDVDWLESIAAPLRSMVFMVEAGQGTIDQKTAKRVAAELAWLESLRDRIAALLPPRVNDRS